MSPTCQPALVLLLVTAVLATNSTMSQGNACKLSVPEAVQKHMAPQQEPLEMKVWIQHLRIRDVPNEGGSFGVEFRYYISFYES